MTAKDIVDALADHYTPALHNSGKQGVAYDEWSLLTEVPAIGSPYYHHLKDLGWEDWTPEAREQSKARTIDVLLIHNWASHKPSHEVIAVEVKVSRADFFRDTAEKRGPWQALAHRFAYAVPEGLITPEEVPEGCWLLEVSEHPCSPEDGSPHTKHRYNPRRVHWHPAVKGTLVTPEPFPQPLTVYLARRASRIEQKYRAAATEHLGETDTEGNTTELIAALRRDLTTSQRSNQQARASKQKVDDRLRELTRLVTEVTPQECEYCRAPIKPTVSGYGYRGTWEHRKKKDAEDCLAARLTDNPDLPYYERSVRPFTETENDDILGPGY